MYNFINYQNSYINGTYYFYQLNSYELPKEANNNLMYTNMNNNNAIRYYTPDKYLKPKYIQQAYCYHPSYNYAAKTPNPSPIRKTLINNYNYNQVKILSQSPEPYLELNSIKNNINNSYLYNKENNAQLNTRLTVIKNKNNQQMQINNIQQNELRAKTPEPNLRRRKKLKTKNSKKINNNYNNKTTIALRQSETKNNPELNNANIININSSNINNNNIGYLNYENIPQNNYYQISDYHYPTNYLLNQINPNNINRNTINELQRKNDLIIRQNRFKGTNDNLEPNDNFNSSQFLTIKKIGEGSYGKIFCIKWLGNNKLYALKTIEINNSETLKELQNKVKLIKNLYNKTNHYGFIRLYGEKIIPSYSYSINYNYFIIMELGERDWEKEVEIRYKHQKYYSEFELYQIIYQLVKTLSLMQKNKICHRDIKPQNILIIDGLYKLCDFGEAKIVDGNGLIQQRVRGSQLFMSPILFYAYNHNISFVKHNTYKSDVFSLGMCFLLAASLTNYALYDIREIVDMNVISTIINNRLRSRYSVTLINLIFKMLQIDENLRMDFIELELFLLNLGIY